MFGWIMDHDAQGSFLLNPTGLFTKIADYSVRHGDVTYLHCRFLIDRPYFNTAGFKDYLLDCYECCNCDRTVTNLVMVLPNYCNSFGGKLTSLEIGALASGFFTGDRKVRGLSEVAYAKMREMATLPKLMDVCPLHVARTVEALEVSARDMLLSNVARFDFKATRPCPHVGNTETKEEILKRYKEQAGEADRGPEDIGAALLPLIPKRTRSRRNFVPSDNTDGWVDAN